MAKQYPFKLDPFQSTAIACIERRESVLVAAHTSGESAKAACPAKLDIYLIWPPRG